MAWKVQIEPEGNNPGLLDKAKAKLAGDSEGRNVGGLIVYVVNGSSKQEVSRVAFARRNSSNPDVTFEDKLTEEIDKARTAVRILNEQLTGNGELQ